MPPGAGDSEQEFRKKIEQQEERIARLEKQLRRMMPTRRDALKAGAVGAVGILGFGAGNASADLNDGDTEWGSSTNRDDYFVDHLDANEMTLDGDTRTRWPSSDVIRQDSTPSDAALGDLWVDTDDVDGAELHLYDGSEWDAQARVSDIPELPSSTQTVGQQGGWVEYGVGNDSGQTLEPAVYADGIRNADNEGVTFTLYWGTGGSQSFSLAAGETANFDADYVELIEEDDGNTGGSPCELHQVALPTHSHDI